MEQIIKAKKIEVFGNVKNPDGILKNRVFTTILRFDEEWKSGLTEICGKASIVIDFGKEMNGGIKIITGQGDKLGVPARVRFGESKSEVNAETGYKNATNDHSPRDFYIRLPELAHLDFGETGFRFVRLDFNEGSKLFIQDICCVNRILSKKSIYRYNGNDALIKKIFSVAKRTIDLCAANGYVVDGIKRDRLVWVGDMHPEMLALTTLYGRSAELENSLDFIRRITPKGSWVNGIFSSYSMWWIIIVADYYKAIGCAEFTKKQLGYVQTIIGQLNDCVKENGDMDYPYYFVDWQTSESDDKYAGVRAVNIMAAKKAIYLLNEFGEPTDNAQILLEKLKKQPIIVKDKKQVVALKYFAGETLTKNDKKLLTEGGAKGLSTFMSYYVLKTIASFDNEKAIGIMKEYYGAMIEKGATTFWEDFNIDWADNSCKIDELPENGQKDIHGDFGDYCYQGLRHSLCHGWSSGVIAFIKENC